eukprot:CAMPEP_0180553098 /NCGR_PEP_ID=MMETSP1036_2-20121128/74096_1 /TAXON_ID=632150 /ORGANISM="Azadinium spinosum, Strain 3D9" /LENGTH=93 /DNA_ID=CAMNT_0022568593 /DNA_START=80 /DNA_END=358 /DNA_ORIENTATION=+
MSGTGAVNHDDVAKQRFGFYEHFGRPQYQQAQPSKAPQPHWNASARPDSAGSSRRSLAHWSESPAIPQQPAGGRPLSARPARCRGHVQRPRPA